MLLIQQETVQPAPRCELLCEMYIETHHNAQAYEAGKHGFSTADAQQRFRERYPHLEALERVKISIDRLLADALLPDSLHFTPVRRDHTLTMHFAGLPRSSVC